MLTLFLPSLFLWSQFAYIEFLKSCNYRTYVYDFARIIYG